jgi:hypothetical protein
MNELHEKLLAQAHIEFAPDSKAVTARFAELIVKECVGIVNKRKDAAIDADWHVDEAMSNAVWDIEEHFGLSNEL